MASLAVKAFARVIELIVWTIALERAEIENLWFHDLRHEATGRFVEAGLSDQ